MIKTALEAVIAQPREKLKNAYLIVCPKESELTAASNKLLLKIYCGNGVSCGVCAGCLKVSNKVHPDILIIKPDETSIKVDEARRVTPFIYQKAFEGGYKTVVIERSELLTIEAQNCLLKPVEEPPANTVFIILARSQNSLLTTVASRCEKIFIRPAGLENTVETLVKRGLGEDRAKLIARISGGYPAEAVSLANDEEYFALREKTLEICKKLCAAKNMGIQRHADFFEENKGNFDKILTIAISYFFDIQASKLSGNTDNILNIDRKKEILEYSIFFTRAGLSNIIDVLCEFERRLRFALNFRLALESMLFEILEVKHKW